MDLYLVRHAIAFDRDPVVWPNDSERALTSDGVEKFRLAARGLHSVVPKVDVVLSSPWTRAWDTALLLAEEAGWPEPELCVALTGGDFEAWSSAIAGYEGASAVALVGHEPHLSDFATWLLGTAGGRALLEMKKGGAAYIECAEPRAGFPAVLRWLLPPRILRRLA